MLVQGLRRRAGGLALAVGLAGVGGLGACTSGSAPDHAAGSDRAASSTSASSGEASSASVAVLDPAIATVARQLLTQRSTALAQADAAAWAATVAEPNSADGRRELAAFDTLLALGVRALGLGPVTATALASDPDTASAIVTLGHQIPGFDRAERTSRRTVTLQRLPGVGWRIRSWLGPTDRWEVFDLLGARVVRAAEVLVVGSAPIEALQSQVAAAQRAQRQVAAALERPAVAAVVIAPATATEAAHLIGRSDPASIEQVAATTIGDRAPGLAAAADRVVLNPAALDRLTETGRRVVLTHELVHVCLRASTGHDLPPWLSEGVAEWVAFTGVDLPVRVVAARLLEAVRASGPPVDLPGPSAFDTSSADLATAYQQAWLAVSRLAELDSGATVRVLIREVGGTPADGRASTGEQVLADTFPALVHRSLADFVADWRAELVALAGT